MDQVRYRTLSIPYLFLMKKGYLPKQLDFIKRKVFFMKPSRMLITLLLSILWLQGCSSIEQDDERMRELLSSCNTTDPMKELGWLADLDQRYEKQSHRYQIRVVEYNNEGYILLEDFVSSSPMSTIFDCSGEIAFNTSLAGVHYNDFMKQIKTVKVLKSKNWPKD